MTQKFEFILNHALSMSPAERVRIAHCLIHSLEETSEGNVDEKWIQLAKKRFKELENGKVKPVSWDEIKKNSVEK
ncbi:addiction module protein [Desulfobacterales bacterium HSG17]|nr:addiction module protein [Desulfobacterales bacterium HSG17]